jgi:PhnB protein
MDKLPPLFPYIVVSDGVAAIEFYKKALGAVEDEEPHFAPGTKKILNARMSIRGGVFMLCDDMMDDGGPLGRSPVMLHLQLDEDIDAAFEKAVKAGATVKMPLMDQFWGDRYGQIADPFGHTWAMGQKVASPTREEVAQSAEAAFKSMQTTSSR